MLQFHSKAIAYPSAALTTATPTFSPGGGTYSSAQTVTISCSTPGSTIYYTTNGTTPTTGSPVYSMPITVASSETVQAIATAAGFLQSAVESANYTISGSGLAITTTSPLSTAISGSQFSQQLTATGGTPPYSWGVTSGNVTPNIGMQLRPDGLFTGVPIMPNSSPQLLNSDSLYVTVYDSAGNSASAILSFPVTLPTGALAIVAPTVPNASVNGTVFAQIPLSGGSSPYTQWSMNRVSGSNSFYVSHDGWVMGTPTSVGTDVITATAIDSFGTSITSGNISIITDGLLRIQNPSYLPPANQNAKYSYLLHAASSVASTWLNRANFTWSIASGSLPAGLSLSSSGAITGIPTGVGTSSVTFQVTDGVNAPGTLACTLTSQASQIISRPAYNSSASNGFFLLNGNLYDPNGNPFTMRGLDEEAYTFFPPNPEAALELARCSAVRMALGFGLTDAQGATNASTLTGASIVPVVTRFATNSVAFFGVPANTAYTGQTNVSYINDSLQQWINGFSSWSPIQGSMLLNIANEWGPSGTIVWRDAYLGVSANITSIVGATITVNTVSAINPFTNCLAVGVAAYVHGAGGITNLLQTISSLGGSSGVWTITLSSAPSGTYTSGGILASGAVAVLRAVGYTCPLVIDVGGAGEDLTSLLNFNYPQLIFNSDPLLNTMFSYHMYGGSISNVANKVSSITLGASTKVTFSNGSSTAPWIWPGWTSPNSPLADFGHLAVVGVSGISPSINAQVAAVTNKGGGANTWALTYALNSSGSSGTASGGMVIDYQHYGLIVKQFAALKAQGVRIGVLEFGNWTTTGSAPGTYVTENNIVGACEAAGLDWNAWAIDDPGYPIPSVRAKYTQPNDLTSYGINMILHPVTGLIANSVRAPVLL